MNFSRIAVIAVTALMLTGCSAGQRSTQVGDIEKSGAVVVAVDAAPATLDFTRTGGAAIPQALMSNVYETLVKINDEGEVTPLLAEKWDVTDDGKTFTFHLRDGVNFSNGDRFTAQTAKFSIDRVKTDAWTNGMKKKMAIVESTEVLDEHTLVVHLKTHSNQWLWDMGTMVGAMMSPQGVDDLSLTQHPVGTGPYTIGTWTPGDSLTFTVRKDYWGEKPKNSGAAIRYFKDATGSSNALQAGDVDVDYSLQAPEMIPVLKEKGNTVQTGTTNGEILLTMNNRSAPFTDIRARKAILYAINRQDVIDTAWYGYGTDTGGVPVPPTDPWYVKGDSYPFNPGKAKELLAEAGLTAPNNKVTLTVPSIPYAQRVSENIVSQLKKVGLDVTIESTEFPAVWLDKVFTKHDYQMSVIMHIEPRDVPHIFGDPDYYPGYDSLKTRDLLKAADEGPLDEYAETMKKAIAQIMEDAAADTLFNYPNIVVTAPGVHGVNPNDVDDALELAPITKKPTK